MRACAPASARDSDRPTALKLIEGLTGDYPVSAGDEPVEIAHREALSRFEELANALRFQREAGHLWYPAQRATQKWLDEAE